MGNKKIDNVIGIDLGGTNVRAAVINTQGEYLVGEETEIEAARGPKFGLEKINSQVARLIDKFSEPVRGIGVGSTGPLDREKGTIQNPFTLPGWENVSIVNSLQDNFGVPVTAGK